MELKRPFCISGRLLPAVKIDDGWLSFDPKTCVFYLDTPEFEYEIDDFRPSCGESIQSCVEDMLSFFAAAIDNYRYYKGDEADPLLPKHVTKWLLERECIISDVEYDINSEDLIT